jgi:hypothetical protein
MIGRGWSACGLGTLGCAWACCRRGFRGGLGYRGGALTVASFIASQRAGYGVANAAAWRAVDVSESWSLASGGIVARPGATSEQRRLTLR